MLQSLEIRNFRCFDFAQFEFDPTCTLIAGANAAGKTSVLEAIYLLSYGRSFRAARLESLVGNGGTSLQVVGHLKHGERMHVLGVEWQDGHELHVDGIRTRSFAPAAELLPVQLIDPNAHELVEGGPRERRRFMDWGVFHVEPRFLPAWRAYSRALDQRNAALKGEAASDLIEIWDQELARHGEALATARETYLQELRPAVQEVAFTFLSGHVELNHKRGWPSDRKLAEALGEARLNDTRYRSTTVGPHRAELDIRIDGVQARDRVSRGQQKLLACALILAQIKVHIAKGLLSPTLLLDDPAAELDVDNLGKLLDWVRDIRTQLVVTALDSSGLAAALPGARFHVEQGIASAVI